MLTYNAQERISAETALNHPWIQIQTKNEFITYQEASEAIYALRNFNVQVMFKTNIKYRLRKNFSKLHAYTQQANCFQGQKY